MQNYLISNLRTDTIADIKYDPRSRKYRIVSGAGKGQFISLKAFLASTDRYLQQQQQELIALGDRLSAGAITLRQFQEQASIHIREIHTSSAILGRGGIHNMTAENWLEVGREVKKHLWSGRDELNGRSFGIKHLAQDVKDGKLTPGQLRSRLQMFAESGRYSRDLMELQSAKDAGKLYAIRSLGVAEHCPECPTLVQNDPISIDRIVLPGRLCSCRSRCKCSVRFLDLSETIEYRNSRALARTGG